MEISRKAFVFENTESGFGQLDTWMEKLAEENGKAKIMVGFEPTGHYWFPLGHHLEERGTAFVVVAPQHVKHSKELDDNTQRKDDRKVKPSRDSSMEVSALPIPPARPTGFRFNRRFPGAKIALDLPDILFAQPGQRRMLPGDIANLHALIGILAVRTIGNGYVIPAVQFLTDYSGAERISFQANHQVQGGGAIAHLDDAVVFIGGQDLLGHIEAALVTLFKGNAWIRLKLSQRDTLFSGKGMLSPETDIWCALYEGMILEFIVPDYFLDGFSIVIVQVENADFTAQA